MTRLRIAAALAPPLVLLLALPACDNGGHGTSGGEAPPPAAKVEKPAAAGEVPAVVLTPEAEARLGVKTVPVEKRQLKRSREFPGEVIVPPGLAITLTAPLAGKVLSPPLSSSTPGAREGATAGPAAAAPREVGAGEVVFLLDPLPSPDAALAIATARIDAEGAVERARAELDGSRLALERAEVLLRERAGNQRGVDEARTAFLVAQAALKGAQARRETLLGLAPGGSGSALGPVEIASPIAGTLLAFRAAPGQLVPAGAPLFEVASLERPWVRVSVYVGDTQRIDARKEALITRPGHDYLSGAGPSRAAPVPAAPSASALSATVDLFYEVTLQETEPLRPGERVIAQLPLFEEQATLVVPWSAVVHDAAGGAWVYVALRPHAFARRRVQVERVDTSRTEGGVAVLATGPGAGAAVVTDGAAELFGIEFGAGK